jgi:hypothetical protein
MQINPTKISPGQLNSRHARKVFSAASVSKCGSRRSINVRAVAEPAVAPAAASAADVVPLDYNQLVREGHYEAPLVQEQVRGSAVFAAVASVVQSEVETSAVLRCLVTLSVWCIPKSPLMLDYAELF